jgi:phage baseplate assembly protein W
MLTIKDFDGNDLVANPPDEANYRSVGVDQTVRVSVKCRIIEDDPNLTGKLVNGTLNWNDGSIPTVYSAVSGTLTINAEKGLTNGVYVINVLGHNHKAPTEDVVAVNFPVNVIQEATKAPPQRLIFGPILPRDSGFPNADQWLYNTESDLLILESSIRMLLLTAKGERLMEPEYGTNIRRILFELNINGVEAAIQEEIVSALTTWEPRLQLQSISVVRNRDRSVTVNCAFLSKLSTQGFDINLEFVQ